MYTPHHLFTPYHLGSGAFLAVALMVSTPVFAGSKDAAANTARFHPNFGFKALVDDRMNKLIIRGIEQETPAHMAGLRNGDILLSIDHQGYRGAEAGNALLARLEKGETVFLLVSRRGRVKHVRFHIPE